jgi:hypothetical protein
MPIKVTSTREFRPMRWLGGFAAACLIAYIAGTTSAAGAPGTPTPTVAACTTR